MDDQFMLTTVDNPYDPFTHYDDWFAFDAAQGYHTPGLLARVANSSDNLSETDNDDEINDAMDFIVFYNPFGVHKKIKSS